MTKSSWPSINATWLAATTSRATCGDHRRATAGGARLLRPRRNRRSRPKEQREWKAQLLELSIGFFSHLQKKNTTENMEFSIGFPWFVSWFTNWKYGIAPAKWSLISTQLAIESDSFSGKGHGADWTQGYKTAWVKKTAWRVQGRTYTPWVFPYHNLEFNHSTWCLTIKIGDLTHESWIIIRINGSVLLVKSAVETMLEMPPMSVRFLWVFVPPSVARNRAV